MNSYKDRRLRECRRRIKSKGMVLREMRAPGAADRRKQLTGGVIYV